MSFPNSKAGRFAQQGKKAAAPESAPVRQETTETPEQDRLRKWLKSAHFKRAIVGGVLESDVWKKIAELNELYERALAAERARYDALLEEYTSEQETDLDG